MTNIKTDIHHMNRAMSSTMISACSSLGQDKSLPSSKVPFAWKLHIMLEDAEKSGNEHIISWVDLGRGFKVYDLDEFMKKVVPHFFKQSKWKSFQRQLYFYGFTRHLSGAYYHPKFTKGNKTLSLSMKPNKGGRHFIKRQHRAYRPSIITPSKESGNASSPEDNFDWMTKIDEVLGTHQQSINSPDEFCEGDRIFIFGGKSFHYVFDNNKYV
jgi:hypothetical protein